jgi:hypothetical protein
MFVNSNVLRYNDVIIYYNKLKYISNDNSIERLNEPEFPIAANIRRMPKFVLRTGVREKVSGVLKPCMFCFLVAVTAFQCPE